MAMSLEIVPVNSSNVLKAIGAACRIFSDPVHHASIRAEFLHTAGIKKMHDDDRLCYEEKIIALVDGQIAGISGSYSYKNHPTDVWLDWTGILPEFAGKGIGKRMVQAAFDRACAKNPSFEQLRIWTWDEPQYDCAHSLYSRMGFMREHYNQAATDGLSLVTVYSKGMGGEITTLPWKDSFYELPEMAAEKPHLDSLFLRSESPKNPDSQYQRAFG